MRIRNERRRPGLGACAGADCAGAAAALADGVRAGMGSAGMSEAERTGRVLLLASYCGTDNAKCTDGLPCLDCLRMCNIVTMRGLILENHGGWDENKRMRNIKRPL